MLDHHTFQIKNLKLMVYHNGISFFPFFRPSLSYHSWVPKLGLHQLYPALLGGTSSELVVALPQGHPVVLSGLLRWARRSLINGEWLWGGQQWPPSAHPILPPSKSVSLPRKAEPHNSTSLLSLGSLRMGRSMGFKYPLAGEGSNHCSEVADLGKNDVLKQMKGKLREEHRRHQWRHDWVMGLAGI